METGEFDSTLVKDFFKQLHLYATPDYIKRYEYIAAQDTVQVETIIGLFNIFTDDGFMLKYSYTFRSEPLDIVWYKKSRNITSMFMNIFMKMKTVHIHRKRLFDAASYEPSEVEKGILTLLFLIKTEHQEIGLNSKYLRELKRRLLEHVIQNKLVARVGENFKSVVVQLSDEKYFTIHEAAGCIVLKKYNKKMLEQQTPIAKSTCIMQTIGQIMQQIIR